MEAPTGTPAAAGRTIRIPADQLANFVSQVSEISNVTSSRESAEDVTLSYADTESRKKALETEQDRLLELMEQAETTEDLLAIESRLTDVRYQLESAASQLKLYDSLVSYSTVYLTVEEVQKLTPVQELSTWGKITTGFRENLQTLGDGLLGLLVFLTAGLPYWIPLALLALLCSFLIRRHRRRPESWACPSCCRGNLFHCRATTLPRRSSALASPGICVQLRRALNSVQVTSCGGGLGEQTGTMQ